ncbi:MAG: bifunctional nuclease family protein [Bacteroidales bacterium]|nr:bifunctional nuclease family protein [Bacteroidales bacterium]
MLLNTESSLQIPIFVGDAEVKNLLIAKEAITIKRPMPHNVIADILAATHADLHHVTIDRVVDGVFYASLHILCTYGERVIDCRVSDAIVLAQMENSPIFVNDNVVAECAFKQENVEVLNANLPRTLSDLETMLRQCEEDENYEQAEKIQQEITRLKKKMS